MYTLNG